MYNSRDSSWEKSNFELNHHHKLVTYAADNFFMPFSSSQCVSSLVFSFILSHRKGSQLGDFMKLFSLWFMWHFSLLKSSHAEIFNFFIIVSLFLLNALSNECDENMNEIFISFVAVLQIDCTIAPARKSYKINKPL